MVNTPPTLKPFPFRSDFGAGGIRLGPDDLTELLDTARREGAEIQKQKDAELLSAATATRQKELRAVLTDLLTLANLLAEIPSSQNLNKQRQLLNQSAEKIVTVEAALFATLKQFGGTL